MNVKPCRWPHAQLATSPFDPISEMRTLLEYLQAPAYVTSVLTTHHGISANVATKRASRIIPHVADAAMFLEQSLAGPAEVSFVPAYYSMLNLAKVYILVGPYHAELTAQSRWHGASYDVTAKDSQNPLTEFIYMKKGGALALFYKTLTDAAITADHKIKMGDLYPLIRDISTEYSIATSNASGLAVVSFSTEEQSGTSRLIASIRQNYRPSYNVSAIPLLEKFKKRPGKKDQFWTGNRNIQAGDWKKEIYSYINRRLIYHTDGGDLYTPICSRIFVLPQEISIILMFFHMSSVARYKPEMLQKIRGSKYWPVFLAARRHCMARFLLLFWSQLHNAQFTIKR